MLAQIISAFFIIMVAIALVPIIQDSVNNVINESMATNQTSVLTSQPTMVIFQFFPLFFVLTIVGVAIVTIIQAFRSAGLIGGVEDDYEDDYENIKKEKPNHKQTYEEYFRERRKIEFIGNHPILSKIMGL